ncbi:BT1 family protein [Ruegeria meonggei]|uniref:BT1 family protein n=1 Tax=Ruegeria meonggei TaxID=1446476 RepID=A0A1X7AF51_9RHOB|nr:BT1 family protein [Ruegeria meonggei]
MASRSIAQVVVLLTIAAGVLALPNLALYYGVHEWTAARTGGVVDARFIAILDTAVESPLGQIAMVPMLAWIARNAPTHLNATFFAVMASFTNMALSASSLGTKYLNQIFTVTRAVTDPRTGTVAPVADYSHLGSLLITVGLISVIVPLAVIFLVQNSPYQTRD